MEERITIRLSAALANKVGKWAKSKRVSKSAFIRDWLIQDLPEVPPESEENRPNQE
jgi:metal-responsive CopG/Arc/MetJ family transcriptional regulator